MAILDENIFLQLTAIDCNWAFYFFEGKCNGLQIQGNVWRAIIFSLYDEVTIMMNGTISRFQALQSFDDAYRRAWWGRLLRQLIGRSSRLLSFADFQKYLVFSTPRDLGIQEVPLEKITGSVGRAKDFDRDFRPLNESMRERWVNILNLHQFTGWAPINLYKVGDIYFVEDGHHRVSVAHQVGIPIIEARVQEYPTTACLSPEESTKHLIDRLRGAYQPKPIASVAGVSHQCC